MSGVSSRSCVAVEATWTVRELNIALKKIIGWGVWEQKGLSEGESREEVRMGGVGQWLASLFVSSSPR